VPDFLQRWTRPLLSAPVSHVVAFLVLHEITAIVPLVGLTVVFHYYHWLPESIVDGEWVQKKVAAFSRMFIRNKWTDDAEVEELGKTRNIGDIDVESLKSKSGSVKLVLEAATAWAVVKLLMPVRVVVSVWATPWFARIAVRPITKLFRRGR
jgi:hypothetical protein